MGHEQQHTSGAAVERNGFPLLKHHRAAIVCFHQLVGAEAPKRDPLVTGNTLWLTYPMSDSRRIAAPSGPHPAGESALEA